MSKLSFTDECIARLLKDGVSQQTKIPDAKGLYVSIGVTGTATFWLRYTDKRTTTPKPGYHNLGAWHPELFTCSNADTQASIWRDNIRRGIYPSKGGSEQTGTGISFPALVKAYTAFISADVKKPVGNRPGEFVVQPHLKTWEHAASYLRRAAARFHDRFANSLDKNDMSALFDSIEAGSSSNRMRQNMISLCKWGNNNTNPATGKPYLDRNWFNDFMKPRKKELGLKKRLKVVVKDKQALPTEQQPIAILWRALRSDPNCPASIHSRRALALTLATAMRSGNVVLLRRFNVIDIDGTNPRLYIYPGDVKKLRYMVIPLNRFAVEVLKEALADAGDDDNAPLFPGNDGEPMCQNSLSKAMLGNGYMGIMEYLGWKGTPLQITPHALRRTSSSMLRQRGYGYSNADIALILDHQSGSGDDEHKTTAGYSEDFTIDDNEGDEFHDRRVELAKALEAALQAVLSPAPVEPSNVVTLRSAA